MTTTADSAQRVADALAAVQNGPPAPDLPPVDPTGMTLAERLARITAEVGPVAKSGRNAHFGYSYQRAEDVGAAVAPLLGRYAVAITPNIEWAKVDVTDTGRTTKGGSPIRDYAVPVIFHIACPVSDMDVPWVGLAIDDSDKGVNKAITAAVKSFLRAQFLIPTGEDDTDSTSGSSAAAEAGSGGSGEVVVPTLAGEVTGELLWAEDGTRMAFRYRTDEDADFEAMKDAVKSIGGRWDKEPRLWIVPTSNAAAAMLIARKAGLTLPRVLDERFPVETADDLAPKDATAAQPPGPGYDPPGTASDESDSVPF